MNLTDHLEVFMAGMWTVMIFAFVAFFALGIWLIAYNISLIGDVGIGWGFAVIAAVISLIYGLGYATKVVFQG